jgi:hypothetical protein
MIPDCDKTQDPVEAKATWARRWALQGALACVVCALGCSCPTLVKEQQGMIEEESLLLENPCPGDPRWDRHRVTVLQDAKRYRPVPSPSPAPPPKGP